MDQVAELGMDETAVNVSVPPGRDDGFLAPVLGLGSDRFWFATLLSAAVALTAHGAGAATAANIALSGELAMFAGDLRNLVAAQLHTELVDAPEPEKKEEPEPKKEEPPPPEKAPEPEKVEPTAKAPDNPYDQPAPAPAEAAKVLTAAPTDTPVDFGDNTIVSGNGERAVGGYVAQGGTGTKPTFDRGAKVGGTPGGTGTAVAPVAPSVDRSRAATVVGSLSWSGCGFPAEADQAQIDSAVVRLSITVGVDGRPQSVSVLSESPAGYGFGAHARRCAQRKSYQAGLDRDGKATVKSTPPVTVYFTR